jgi:hypothetical protein
VEIINFDRAEPLPIIDAHIFGPRNSLRVKLILDTGAEFTIVDTGLIEEIGYSARDAKHISAVLGASGDAQDGYILEMKALRFFGKKAKLVTVGAFDFDHFAHFGAHGVLGFDVIKQLHLEMDGPKGVLKVF